MKNKTSMFDKLILSAYNFYWTNREQAETARQRIEHILDLLSKYGANSGDRILDAACGSGFYTLALAQAGFQTVGIDFVPLLLDRAQAKAKELKLAAEFEKMNLDRELWFDQAEFNHAVCLLALHQLGDPPATLRELHRIIKPDGLLLLTLWTDQTHYPEEFQSSDAFLAENSPKERAKERVKNLGERAFKAAHNFGERHNPPQFWNDSELDWMLSSCGFEILESNGQPLQTTVARRR